MLQLVSEMASASDAFVFYQVSSAGLNGMAAAAKGNGLSKTYSDLGKGIADDAFQKERLLEHDRDQIRTINQQLFAALGQARVLFPEDEILDRLISTCEDLPEFDDQKPDAMVMLKQPDINAFLKVRRRHADAEIKRVYGVPLDAVLTHLRQKIQQYQK